MHTRMHACSFAVCSHACMYARPHKWMWQVVVMCDVHTDLPPCLRSLELRSPTTAAHYYTPRPRALPVRMCLPTYVRICVNACACVYTCVQACMVFMPCVQVCMCMCVCTCRCVSVCVGVRRCASVCVGVVGVCRCVHLYMCACTHPCVQECVHILMCGLCVHQCLECNLTTAFSEAI